MTRTRIVVLALLAGLGLIQLVPVDRENPPVRQRLQLPPAADQIARQACYDCHSNETRWPWYSYVAPVSWLVAHDVEEGREHLNFSDWDRLEPKRQAKRLEEAAEEVAEGEMPMRIYQFTHSEARLNAARRRQLVDAFNALRLTVREPDARAGP